jgi:FMN-dependent NADH-azoreductase
MTRCSDYNGPRFQQTQGGTIMAHLLYIEASPRKDRSASISVAKNFIEAYRENHNNGWIETIDLWQTPLPECNDEVINAKYAIYHGREFTEAQKKAWGAVEKVIAQFAGADRYLFSLPMWNFGIPYKLKQYIDVIVQPGYTFSFSPGEGYKGLVTGKPLAAVYSRAGAYGPDSGMESYDLQKTYLETVLGFIGFSDFQTIVIEETLGPAEAKDKNIAAARRLAQKIAADF